MSHASLSTEIARVVTSLRRPSRFVLVVSVVDNPDARLDELFGLAGSVLLGQSVPLSESLCDLVSVKSN